MEIGVKFDALDEPVTGERSQISSNFSQKRGEDCFYKDEDLFNKFPDAIIVSILSLLTLKEAGRTSVLSRRWRSIWTLTTRLAFDNSLVALDAFKWKLEEEGKRAVAFSNLVNKVLDTHQGLKLDEFILSFDSIWASSKSDVDGWIKFALHKQVQRLHLDLSSSQTRHQWHLSSFRSSQNFQYYPLTVSSKNHEKYPLTTQTLQNYNLNFLKVVYLNMVEVASEVVEYLVFHCPCLEGLCIKTSKFDVYLNVSGPLLSFRLDFDPLFELYGSMSEMEKMGLKDRLRKFIELKRARFINWVNKVLESHRSLSTYIDDVTICFDMAVASFESDITCWINFAFEKRVQRLHLDSKSSGISFDYRKYNLTTQILSNHNLDSLMVLHLKEVEVNDEVVEYVLSYCPELEILIIKKSDSLKHLKVSGPSLKLRRLEITDCGFMESMEIFAVNLMSLKYFGRRVKMSLYIPNLIEAYVGGWHACFLVKKFDRFSSHLCQLETLVLDLSVKAFRNFPDFPELKKLKQLELKLNAHSNCNLDCCMMLKKAPMLYRLILEISWRPGTFGWNRIRPTDSCQSKKQVFMEQHGCLKVVEFIGFIGQRYHDVGMVQGLLERAASVEKLVLKLDKSLSYQRKLAARGEAEKLRSSLPANAQLVIV